VEFCRRLVDLVLTTVDTSYRLQYTGGRQPNGKDKLMDKFVDKMDKNGQNGQKWTKWTKMDKMDKKIYRK
jgi:hypothetical protein